MSLLLRTFAKSRLSLRKVPPIHFERSQTLKGRFRFMSSSTSPLHCVHVFIKTKPGTEVAFHQASLKNALNSAQEQGVVRFDVLQDQDDPNRFVLVEVYKDATVAPAAHKETAHYAEWRDTVADMMAEPRQARKFKNLFPTTLSAWEYPKSEDLEG